jgi:hypothetical protein
MTTGHSGEEASAGLNTHNELQLPKAEEEEIGYILAIRQKKDRGREE